MTKPDGPTAPLMTMPLDPLLHASATSAATQMPSYPYVAAVWHYTILDYKQNPISKKDLNFLSMEPHPESTYGIASV